MGTATTSMMLLVAMIHIVILQPAFSQMTEPTTATVLTTAHVFPTTTTTAPIIDGPSTNAAQTPNASPVPITTTVMPLSSPTNATITTTMLGGTKVSTGIDIGIIVASWVSLAGIGGASSIARVSLKEQLFMCKQRETRSARDLSLVWVPVESDCGSVKSLDGARGTAAANLMLMTIGAAVVCMLGFILSVVGGNRRVVKTKKSCVSIIFVVLRDIAFPSILLPITIVLLPSSAHAVVEMMSTDRTTGCVSDYALLICLGVALITPIGTVLVTWRFVVGTLDVTLSDPPALEDSKPQGVNTAVSGHHQAAVLLGAIITEISALPQSTHVAATEQWRQWTWQRVLWYVIGDPLRDEGIPHHHTARHALLLLSEYRVLWYGALDIVVVMTASLVSAVSGLGEYSSRTVCVASGGAVLALFLCQIVLSIVCRPFSTQLGNLHTITTLAITIVATILGLVGVMTAADDDPFGSTALQIVSSVCDWIVAIMSMLRFAMDVTNLYRAVHDRLVATSTRQQQQRTRPQPRGTSRQDSELPRDGEGHPDLDSGSGASSVPLLSLTTSAEQGADNEELAIYDERVDDEGDDSKLVTITVTSSALLGRSQREAMRPSATAMDVSNVEL